MLCVIKRVYICLVIITTYNMSNQNNHKEVLELTPTDLLIESKNFHLSRIEYHRNIVSEIDRMTGTKPTNGQLRIPHLKTSVHTEKKQNMSWSKPIVQLFKKENRLLKTKEIVNLLYPSIDEATLSEYVITVSGVLTGLRRRKKIKQSKEDKKGNGKGHFYGLPDWFNGDKPKQEYMKK